METKGGLGDNKEGKQTFPLQGRHRMHGQPQLGAAVNDIYQQQRLLGKAMRANVQRSAKVGAPGCVNSAGKLWQN